MNLSTLYEITSNDRLMNSLGLAVAEAKLVRTLIRDRKTSLQTDRDNGHLQRLMRLNREIDYLEAKLKEVESKSNRG